MSNSNEASSDREKIAREIKQIVRHINVSCSLLWSDGLGQRLLNRKKSLVRGSP